MLGYIKRLHVFVAMCRCGSRDERSEQKKEENCSRDNCRDRCFRVGTGVITTVHRASCTAQWCCHGICESKQWMYADSWNFHGALVVLKSNFCVRDFCFLPLRHKRVPDVGRSGDMRAKNSKISE